MVPQWREHHGLLRRLGERADLLDGSARWDIASFPRVVLSPCQRRGNHVGTVLHGVRILHGVGPALGAKLRGWGFCIIGQRCRPAEATEAVLLLINEFGDALSNPEGVQSLMENGLGYRFLRTIFASGKKLLGDKDMSGQSRIGAEHLDGSMEEALSTNMSSYKFLGFSEKLAGYHFCGATAPGAAAEDVSTNSDQSSGMRHQYR